MTSLATITPIGPPVSAYRTPFVEVQETPVRFPNGVEGSYARINAGRFGGVCIPRNVHRGITYYGLIEQYRFPIDRVSAEFPGGFTEDAGAEEAAREMMEETGITGFAHPIHLGVIHADPGILGAENHIWLVNVTDRGDEHHVESETGAKVRWVCDGELAGLITRGDITSGITLGALSLLNASAYSVAPGAVL